MEPNQRESGAECHCHVCKSICPCSGLQNAFEKHFQLQPSITSEVKATLLKNILHEYVDNKPLFNSKDWKLEKFSQAESEMFQVKSLLNSFQVKQWNIITYRLDLSTAARKSARFLFGPLSRHTLTVTWSKLRELLVTYHDDLFKELISSTSSDTSQPSEFLTLHLCEMPGSFVRSLKFYIQENFPDIQHKWLATSLNHYHELYDVLAAEFISYRNIAEKDYENWFFFDSDKGNLLDKDDLRKAIAFEETPGRKTIVRHHYDLITCDGGFSCEHSPEKQEILTLPLKFTEVITSIVALKTSGCLIIKFYTIYESNSICLVYLLYLLFEQVHITKPFTSKHGNSEVYLVCTNYLPDDTIDTKTLELLLDQILTEVHKAIPNGDNTLFDKSFVDERFVDALFAIVDQFNTYQSNCIQQSLSMSERIANRDSCCSVNLAKTHSESKKFFITKTRLDTDIVADLCKRYEEEVANSILNLDHENYLESPLEACNRIITTRPLRRLKHSLSYEERVRFNDWTATRYAFDARGLPKVIGDFELAALCKNIFLKILYVDSDESRQFMEQKNLWLTSKLVDCSSVNFRSIKSTRFCDLSLLNLWINLKNIHERLIQTDSLKLRQECHFGPSRISSKSNFYNHPFKIAANAISVAIRNELLLKILPTSEPCQNGLFEIIEWPIVLESESKSVDDQSKVDSDTVYNIGKPSIEYITTIIKQYYPSSTIHLGSSEKSTPKPTKVHSVRSRIHVVSLPENRDDDQYYMVQDEWAICRKLVETLIKLLNYELENENHSKDRLDDTIIIFTLPHMLTRATVGLLFLLHNAIFEQFCIIPRIPFYNIVKRSDSNSQNWRERSKASETIWDYDISLNQLIIMKSSADAKTSRYKTNLLGVLSILADMGNKLAEDANLVPIEFVATPFLLINKRFYEQIYAANFVRILVESCMIKAPVYDNVEKVREIKYNEPNLVPHLVLHSNDFNS